MREIRETIVLALEELRKNSLAKSKADFKSGPDVSRQEIMDKHSEAESRIDRAVEWVNAVTLEGLYPSEVYARFKECFEALRHLIDSDEALRYVSLDGMDKYEKAYERAKDLIERSENPSKGDKS